PVLQRNSITDYALNAGTTAVNAQRLLRALQLNKPILLEGSPGVGKTSLVAALAKASGNCLVRINLSEQTDVTDLFGTDLPVEGGRGGEFAWRDGPLLAALKAGHWIVLDEVYVDPLAAADMEFIGSTLFPAIDKSIISKMVAFNNKIDKEVMAEKKWGQKGGPWEFNLRDLFRWCQLMLVDQSPGGYDPGQHVFLVYGERMRTREDKEKVISVFRDVFGQEASVYTGTRDFHITPYNIQIGYSILSRGNYIPRPGRNLSLLHHSLQTLESIMKCVHMSWMVILVGPAAVGKTSLVELLAHLTGHRLKIMAMNSAMDTTELLGGFEQVDINRPWLRLLEKVESVVSALVRDSLLLTEICADDAELVLRAWSNFILNYKPKSLGEGGRSVTAELVSKLEGILVLTQRLNNKISSYSKAEFAVLVEEFRRLKLQQVQAADSNSLGTFEWVDGMLVQALQCGDWLLMDNVNFCNPSVLDRLNALLEPGGVLTMSERGVIDGTIPTIAPHPNFRLFLSMDPVHGEISRAMRNRGIEIYISGENDGNILDNLDLKLLLHGLGLMGDSICDALLAVHSETKTAIPGSVSSLSPLLQAAVLIVQQMQRGLGLVKSFYRACWEVYGRSQQLQINQKLVLELVMKHVSSLASHEIWGDSLLAMGLWPDSLPTGLFTAEDSLLSTVRSDGQVLIYCLNRLNLKNCRTLPLTLQDLQKIMQSSHPENLRFGGVEIGAHWVDEMDVLQASVKLFIEKATNQDWTLRVKWLNFLAKNLPQVLDPVRIQLEAGAVALGSFYASSLSSGISNMIKLLQPTMTDEHVMPLDPRWNVQFLDIIRNSINFDTETEHTDQLLILLKSVANRAVLFLEREKRSYAEKNLIISKKPRTSALRMSLDFHKDPGSYSSLPHAVVVNLAAFFELWDVFTLHWVTSTQVALSDDDMHDILYCLLWRDRFWTVSDTLTVDSPGLSLLSLHWHWVVKHLIDRIPQMLIGSDQHKVSKEIQSVSQQLQNCLANPAGTSANMKLLQKSLGRPLPFKDKLGMECFSLVKVLSKPLNILDARLVFGESRWQEKMCCLKAAATGWRTKKALLQADGLILRANHLEDVNLGQLKNSLKAVHAELRAEGLKFSHSEERFSEDTISNHLDPPELIQLCSRVQLWPAMEYMGVLWQYKLSADYVAKAYARRYTDSRLQGIMLSRQLSALVDLVPADLQEEFLNCCEKLFMKDLVSYEYLLKILRSITDQELLPKEFTALLLTCLQQFFGEELKDLPETAWRGSLWVNIGLLQIQVWLPQTRFDPAIKREYKLKYAKEELHQLECEWKTNDLSSQLRTGKSLQDEALSNYIHPHLRLLQERMQRLNEQISSLSRKKAFRPAAPLYDGLYQEAHQYINSIAKVSSVQDLLARLLQFLGGQKPKSLQAIKNLLSEEASWQQSHHHFRKHLAEEYAIFPDTIVPLQAAILQLQHGMRLVASEVCAVLNGFVCPADLTNLLTALLLFPSVGHSFPTYFARAEILCSVNSVEVLHGLKKFSLKHCEGESEGVQKSCPTLEQLLVNALLHLRCHVLSREEMDLKSLQLFRHLCQAIINEWDEQERRAQEQEAMEKSLYRFRSKSHGKGQSEEEEEEEEFRRRFPFHEKDFEDIMAQASLEEKMETGEALEDQLEVDRALLSKSSMQTVMMVHQQLCLNFARSLWYQQSLPSHQAKHYFTAFISCYQTGACLVSQFYPLIGAEMNSSLLGSQLLVSTLLQNTFFEELTSDLALQQDGPYDFYQHPNIKQVRQCQPVLDNFAKEVNRLLQEWPEHPVLLQLLVVIDRIQSFPLSSPLSKFLNGLEILLAKAQDWEENASRALSLRKHLDLVTQLIIQWRRLELNCWSVSLDNIMKQHVEKSTKHWFSLYQMIEKYVQEQTKTDMEETEQMSLKTLISTLQAFIEGSTLGEFHGRLKALLVFHCHVLLMPQVAEKDILCSILWNLYNYYKQFLECVETRITELRQPIEKELKEFVKISKWNDVSFWAIKQSVEKTRRTLFKFMKKFEVVLNEPCRPALVETGKEEQLDCLHQQEEAENKESKVQKLNTILRKILSARTDAAKQPLTEECQDVVTFHTDSLQYRLPKLTKKMKKMCVTVTESNSFLSLLESLDQFTGDIIGSVVELQSLTFDKTADKEKQKSEAKHIQMQKQRALSDLFKSLAKTERGHEKMYSIVIAGLSYRKGLSWSRSKGHHEILYVHPLDLRSALTVVNNIHELDATFLEEISSAWDGCQKYFYRSLARHSRLQVALLAPAKDIGLGSVERCKGFTAHLLRLLVTQRQSLTALMERWILLRNLLSCIQEIDKRLSADREYNVAFPPQSGFQHWTDKLQQLSTQCVMVLEELSWFIQCCPTEEQTKCADSERTDVKGNTVLSSGPEEMLRNVLAEIPDRIPSELKYLSPVTSEQLPPGCRMRNKDQLWLQLSAQLAAMLARVKAMKTQVGKIRLQSSETLFYSWRDFEVCASAVSCLLETSAQLQGVESLFHPKEEDRQAADQMAVIRSLKYIQEEINSTSADFAAWRTQLLSSTSNCSGNKESGEEFVERFSDQVETVIHGVLYGIQCLVERKQKGGEEEEPPEETAKDDAASFDRIKAGHLTKLLDEGISADVDSLHVQKVTSSVSELMESLKSYGEDCTSDKHKFFNQSCYLLVRLEPMLCKFSDLILFYLTISLSSHRSTGKLLSVLTSIFTELAQKGFCLPKELLEDEAGEGATQFHDYEDGGIGDGEGKKDIEDSFKKGEEKEKEDQDSKPDIEGEDNAIEMSEDFEGKMHDGEQEKKENDEQSDEEEELDKQMGDLNGAEADDKLDERLWGDEDDDDEDGSSKGEETGPGMDEEDSELVAKDDNLGAGSKDNKKQPPKDEEAENGTEDNENKEKIHEQIDEREYDENEVDPYHGQQEKQPEVEPLDLPDNLNLENDEKSDEENEGEEEEENAFEIDEKPVDLNETENTEGQKEEDTSEAEGGDQDAEPAEEGVTEEKDEKDEKGDEGEQDTDEQEENTGNPEEAEEEESQPPKEEKTESAEEEKEKGIPAADQGLQPQEEEDKDNPEMDEQIPESEERMEHETQGQTGQENLQSDSAVELAGEASERDQSKEEYGSGAASANQSEGHESTRMARMASEKQSRKNTQSFKRKPGQADNERSMGDHNERIHKRLRTIESNSEAKQNTTQSKQNVEEADAFEHIKESSERYDAQTYDVASKEQEKPIVPLEEKEEGEPEDTAMETEMQNEDLQAVDIEELKPETKSTATKTSGIVINSVIVGPGEEELETQILDSDHVSDSAKEKLPEVTKEKPERSKDSTIHTAHQFLMDASQHIVRDPEELRKELERQLEAWQTQQSGSPEEEKEAAQLWQRYLVLTAPLSQQLCEQLRLILEPTQAAKLKGDYRTGKRLNMRKVIPYIASQFRKDKIWLRRTKPSKRQYQICLAIDDSSSMIDNHSKQDSILDIKVPIFKGPGELPEIRSYMEEFPFPFYMILRDVNALPETLSDALRQWFELVTASDTL
ncbi:hypothetical protein ASZ78_011040, partial [Callipepla squamata]